MKWNAVWSEVMIARSLTYTWTWKSSEWLDCIGGWGDREGGEDDSVIERWLPLKPFNNSKSVKTDETYRLPWRLVLGSLQKGRSYPTTIFLCLFSSPLPTSHFQLLVFPPSDDPYSFPPESSRVFVIVLQSSIFLTDRSNQQVQSSALAKVPAEMRSAKFSNQRATGKKRFLRSNKKKILQTFDSALLQNPQLCLSFVPFPFLRNWNRKLRLKERSKRRNKNG